MSWAIRGRLFDFEGGGGGGGGWQIWLGLSIVSMSSSGKFIFRYTKARIFIFTRNKIFKKAKKKKKKKKTRGREGGSECWLRREAVQEFPPDFFFLQTTGMCTHSVNSTKVLSDTLCIFAGYFKKGLIADQFFPLID